MIDAPVLGIEASGTLTGVALVVAGRLLGERSGDTRASRQELLLAQVAELLRDHGLRVRDLARIGVSLGPGSFTGLRVGLAAARALAWGAGVPLVGVPSHQAMALPFQGTDQLIVLLTGLRRGLVCLEAGAWEGPRWQVVREVQAVPVDEALAWIRTIPPLEADRSGSGPASAPVPLAPSVPSVSGLAPRPRLLFLGEAVESLCSSYPEAFSDGAIPSDPLLRARRPAAVAVLASSLGAVEQHAETLPTLEPLYVRGADAVKPHDLPLGRFSK